MHGPLLANKPCMHQFPARTTVTVTISSSDAALSDIDEPSGTAADRRGLGAATGARWSAPRLCKWRAWPGADRQAGCVCSGSGASQCAPRRGRSMKPTPSPSCSCLEGCRQASGNKSRSPGWEGSNSCTSLRCPEPRARGGQ